VENAIGIEKMMRATYIFLPTSRLGERWSFGFCQSACISTQSRENTTSPSNEMSPQCKQHDQVVGICIDTDIKDKNENPLISIACKGDEEIYMSRCSFSNLLTPLAAECAYVTAADIVMAHPIAVHAVPRDEVHVVVQSQVVEHADVAGSDDSICSMHFFGVIIMLLAVPAMLWLARCVIIYTS